MKQKELGCLVLPAERCLFLLRSPRSNDFIPLLANILLSYLGSSSSPPTLWGFFFFQIIQLINIIHLNSAIVFN